MPAALLATIIVLDLLDGPHASISGQCVMVPLVAACLLSVGITAIYGAIAFVTTALLGIYSHSYAAPSLVAQEQRLGFMVASTLIACVVARIRIRREDRLRTLISIAETTQQVLLPNPPPSLGRIAIVADYQSAASDARIGGDFYDAQSTPWGVRLLVGDVRGKGLDAVRMAGVVMACFRERASERNDLVELVADLDRAVRREASDAEEFVTAAVAEVDDDGSLRIAVAGHPPPLLIRDGKVHVLAAPPPSLPLGTTIGTPSPTIVQMAVIRGDRLLFYTDGTTEARTEKGDFFPLDQRAATIMAQGSLREAIVALHREVQEWTGGRLHDDAALLAIEIGDSRV